MQKRSSLTSESSQRPRTLTGSETLNSPPSSSVRGSTSLAISSVNNLPDGQSLQQTISNLNILRATSAPGQRNVNTRGKPAEPVTLSTLPAVKLSDFDAYIEGIKDEWASYQNNKIAPAENGSMLDALECRDDYAFPPIINQKPQQSLPALDQVPSLYMKEDFDLTLPRTFNAVTANELAASSKDGTSGQSSLGDLATDQMLQEKLSHYLDIVEMHLAHEISIRSASFFSALSNLQSLHSQSELALARLIPLKQELTEIDESSATKGLLIVAAGAKRRKLQDITQAIDRLKEVWRAAQQAADLADSGEWEGALGLVEEVEEALSAMPGDNGAEQPAGFPLTKLTALRQMPDRLLHIRTSIGRALHSELTSVLAHEMEERIPEYSDEQDWESFKVKEKASERTRPLVRGLIRCGSGAIEQGVAGWRQAVFSQLQNSFSLVRLNLCCKCGLSGN